MSNSATWILGSEVVRRAFPSFSVIEIIPVSATAKFAPLIPISALQYFIRISRRAVIVSSSGLSVSQLQFFVKKMAYFIARQVHRRKHEVIRSLALSWTMNSPKSDSTTS